MRAIKKLLEIIAYLRSKDGCAWDKKQTPESLLPHLEEETWEVMDVFDKAYIIYNDRFVDRTRKKVLANLIKPNLAIITQSQTFSLDFRF